MTYKCIRAWREPMLKKLYILLLNISQLTYKIHHNIPYASPSVSTFSFPSTTEPVFSVSTSEPVFESPNHSQTSQTTQSQQLQQYHTTTVSNNNAKFPYLKKEEYETWAMKMEYWIMNSDHNLWNIVLNGNSRKKTGRDPKGNIMILPPVSVEEHIAVQRETKARTILLQSLPEDHMADFHHLDDARDIWLAVKARFGGNDESKKMRKSMLKQEFSEFRVSESEGLHKGYDRFQKILSQLNQMQAKPDNEDCNMKFLRALPPSWSQVAITLKTKGGLDYLSFDDLYNKLRTLEIDVKGGSSYDSRGTSAPTHSAFISAASTNSKMSYPDQSHSTTFTSASSSPAASSNVIENVLHSFVAESDPQQQITYEDFDQIGKLDLEELDIKWQMAMLSVRINRFEKKAGRKMKFNNKDAARFDKKKVKCYKCSELGHFARECTGKQLDSKARYSSFKLKELDKSEEPKALLSVDSMLNWSDHEGEDVENGAAQVYGMIAGAEDDAASSDATGDVADDVSNAAAEFALMGISSQVHTCPFGCEHLYAELKKEFDNLEVQYKECYIQVQAYKSTLQTLEQQKGWYQSNQLALEERIRILTANLENTTNMLRYTEKLNEQAKLENLNDKVKLEESNARFDKWKESSKNLVKLINSSMSSRSRFGLGFGDTFGSDEVFDLSAPSIFDSSPKDVAEKPLNDRFVKTVGMHAVPPPITGTFMPPSNKPDLDDTQFTYGSKSNNYSESNSVSNDFVSCDNSDKSSDSETTDFASCVSSVKSSSSKTNEPLASAPSSVDFKTVSETADQQSNSTNDDSSFSFKENVKPPRNLCNKSGINSRSFCKRKSFGSKTCFVCSSKFHLIKDYDFYEKQLELHNKPMWNNVANIPSFVPKAASVPAGSRNKPTSVPAGRKFYAEGRCGNDVSHQAGCFLENSKAKYCNGDPRINGDLNQSTWFKSLNDPSKAGQSGSQSFKKEQSSTVSILSDFKPEGGVTCLLAKASLAESTTWHRRMAHVNFKNMNKLAKHGLAYLQGHTAVRTISAASPVILIDLFGLLPSEGIVLKGLEGITVMPEPINKRGLKKKEKPIIRGSRNYAAALCCYYVFGLKACLRNKAKVWWAKVHRPIGRGIVYDEDLMGYNLDDGLVGAGVKAWLWAKGGMAIDLAASYGIVKGGREWRKNNSYLHLRNTKVSSMMASIDEDVEKSSLADQDDVGSGGSSSAQNKSRKYRDLSGSKTRHLPHILRFAPIPLQRVTPSSRSSRSSDHRRSRDASPDYDRCEGRNVSLRYSDDRDY
ncbi:putative ribonuclease H-like domain-containing protein [Tanacetum coccineum]|uniref:Ribonuclease H-like domain-containing protein n=1 Tax=Tanacetum coccineum TaxID=301880 RepID=A0ABQ5J3T2_9ASTR